MINNFIFLEGIFKIGVIITFYIISIVFGASFAFFNRMYFFLRLLFSLNVLFIIAFSVFSVYFFANIIITVIWVNFVIMFCILIWSIICYEKYIYGVYCKLYFFFLFFFFLLSVYWFTLGYVWSLSDIDVNYFIQHMEARINKTYLPKTDDAQVFTYSDVNRHPAVGDMLKKNIILIYIISFIIFVSIAGSTVLHIYSSYMYLIVNFFFITFSFIRVEYLNSFIVMAVFFNVVYFAIVICWILVYTDRARRNYNLKHFLLFFFVICLNTIFFIFNYFEEVISSHFILFFHWFLCVIVLEIFFRYFHCVAAIFINMFIFLLSMYIFILSSFCYSTIVIIILIFDLSLIAALLVSYKSIFKSIMKKKVYWDDYIEKIDSKVIVNNRILRIAIVCLITFFIFVTFSIYFLEAMSIFLNRSDVCFFDKYLMAVEEIHTVEIHLKNLEIQIAQAKFQEQQKRLLLLEKEKNLSYYRRLDNYTTKWAIENPKKNLLLNFGLLLLGIPIGCLITWFFFGNK